MLIQTQKIFISHRGNLFHKIPEKENTISYIELAINSGFDCEIDVWKIGNKFFLGHDEPMHNVSLSFLINHLNVLWIHCKNYEALAHLSAIFDLNVFWHQSDNYTLTSKNYIWTYPNVCISEVNNMSIIVLDDSNKTDLTKEQLLFGGFCADNIASIKAQIIHR